MKIIELLNKIANKEEVPKKIKYKGHIYQYQYNEVEEANIINYYYSEETHYHLIDGGYHDIRLNDEVEVIEDKKIEYIEGRIKNFKHYIEDSCFRVQPLEDLELNQNEIVIIDKINEIIKKINKLETK